jgi:inorganic triphosphatase YgiF
VAVSQEFEVDTHHVKTMELLNLRQTRSVEEYKHQFDQLVYHIRVYDSNISETMLVVSQFLLGLKSELKHPIEMHLPNLVAHAAILASMQEHLNDITKASYKKFHVSKLDS